MSSFFVSRSAKKKAQHKKNRYQQMLYELVRFRREEVAREVDEQKQKAAKKTLQHEASSEEDLVWSAKMGDIRNRLTQKKRASQDRWNRFAGTSDAGARGR